MKILVVGYAYIKRGYLDTFNYYPEKDKIFFLLPKIWKAKGGKLTFKPPARNNIYSTRALFYHSNYPVVGGLFKGLMPVFPLFLFKLYKKIDTVYSSSEPILLTTLYQGFWTKFFGKKHIIFSWENVSYDKKLKGLKGCVQKMILRSNLFFCDGIICGNKKSAEIFKNLTAKPVEVIPLSGVDADFFRKKSGEKKFRDIILEGKIVFTFAGAIGYRKGIHLIMESLGDVVKEVPNSYLIIAGSGEYEGEVKSLVEEKNLGGYVHFVPWLNKEGLFNLLNITDVFLYPSISFGGWEEQFGYSMAEASLMDVPIIATKTGSIEEVVKDGITGILVEQNNPKSLTEAMIWLAKNEELRKNMGQAGRRHIAENFAYDTIAGKFHEFFKKITLHR